MDTRFIIISLICLGPAILSFMAWNMRCYIVSLQGNAPTYLHEQFKGLLRHALAINIGAVVLAILIFVAGYHNWWSK